MGPQPGPRREPSLNRLSRLALISALALRTCTAAAQAPLPPEPHKPQLLLGAAWYPEQWPESRWDADLDLMQKAGINFVRVGEFAWSTMEPHEGQYDLDWLYRAVRAAEKHGIVVVIGTPTAAPPAWLTTAYPQTLRTTENGRKDEHGNRQHFDFADPKYRELARAIDTQLGKRFGHDPDVIAWQIDNEYSNASYGPGTRKQFQDWLQARYKTLDNLNARWTTAYWSETYQAWSQIPLQETEGNPGLMLNWKDFVSDTWRSYQRNQLDVLRPLIEPRQKITTNMMGWFDGYDHYTVAQDLDFASWDDYVRIPHLDPAENGAIHDLTRGFLHKNFWVMETQPGFVNWKANNVALDKGEIRAMAWNDIGHGAEAVEYWQWRSDLNGQEEYHGTLVGADGTPSPFYAEVQQLGIDFKKTAATLAGTSVHAEAAVLHDYDSRWAIERQKHNSEFNPITSLMTFYRPLHQALRSVDVVSDTAPLTRYKLVVAPALNVLTPKAIANLQSYVQNGGHLVFGQRSAMKDADNTLFPQQQPGPFAAMLGARVAQFYALDTPVPVTGDWTSTSGTGNSTQWAEQLDVTAPDTKVLMRYGVSNSWLDNQPAAVTRRVGKGSITYIGAGLDPATMTQATAWMLGESDLKPILPNIPADIDVAIRTGAGKTVLILTNYAKTPTTIPLPAAGEDLLNGGKVSTVTLPPYGVAVLSLSSGLSPSGLPR